MRRMMCARARRAGFRLGIAGLALVLCSVGAEAARVPGYEYVSPVPGSDRVSRWNNIVLRRSSGLESWANPPAATVRGSVSGAHAGAWTLSDDARTWVFAPATPFLHGETVTVTLGPATGPAERSNPAPSFQFTIAAHDPVPAAPEDLEASLGASSPPALDRGTWLPAALSRAVSSLPCDTMSVGFLPVTVVSSNNPDPGNILISPRLSGGPTGSNLVILDNFGVPIFHRFMDIGSSDFTRQYNGLLTFYSNQRSKYYAFDSSYAVVDSFATGNGYRTDGHELILLPNGHHLMMSYDRQTVAMDQVVPGGNPSASVIGLIIQELDAAKNVVFQWRSWDHFQITDMIEVPGRTLTGSTIDYSHGNAIELDFDGHLMISSRHMNEITKINRQTGDIIWRFGKLAKNNQFTVLNDPRGFSHQHDIRRLPNGNVTLYDNGTFTDSLYSRAVEYALDEQNRIATQVWEFRDTPDNYGRATGSARRSSSGATLINWGLFSKDPKVTEVHADDTKALELAFGDTLINTYRAVRYPWRTNLFVPDADSLHFGTIAIASPATLPLSIRNNSTSSVELTCFASSDPAVSVVDWVPLVIPAGGDAVVQVQFDPLAAGDVDARLHIRSVRGSELIAQVVRVTGTGTPPSGVGDDDLPGVRLTAQPNPGRGVQTLAFRTPAAGRVTLDVYDLSGRRVATLFDGNATAGRHQATWSGGVGRDGAGSGLYFARLWTPAGTRTLKLVNLAQ